MHGLYGIILSITALSRAAFRFRKIFFTDLGDNFSALLSVLTHCWIADVFKSSRPYEQYNTNLSNAGINVMPTVATNYMYPGTTTTGNIGGFMI